MQKAEKKLALILKKYDAVIREENLSKLSTVKQLKLGEVNLGKKFKKYFFGVVLCTVAAFLFKIYTVEDTKVGFLPRVCVQLVA